MTKAAATERRFGCPTCRAIFRTGFARCPIDGTALQELVDDPLAGCTFADRYVIEDCIGEGGMGRVYRARHQRMSRRFAIKILYGEHATDEKMRDRFAREAESASRLHHPNVISVVDFGETESGLLYLVMDFVEGRELSQVIKAEGPFSRERVIDMVAQLAAGLQHAHDEGLVHRDFKTENVIVTDKGGRDVPRIVDFGIAVMMERLESERLTTEGLVIGTPAYMSPEHSTGREVDHRSDLFSLGVMMYEMMAGVLPFEGLPIAIARQNLSMRPPPVSKRVPGLTVDGALEAVAFKLMEKVASDRYQSGRDVIAALDELVGADARARYGVPVVAVVDAEPAQPAAREESARLDPGPTTAEIDQMAQNRRRRWAIGAALGTSLGLFLAMWWVASGDPEPTEVKQAVDGERADDGALAMAGKAYVPDAEPAAVQVPVAPAADAAPSAAVEPAEPLDGGVGEETAALLRRDSGAAVSTSGRPPIRRTLRPAATVAMAATAATAATRWRWCRTTRGRR